MTMGDDLHPNGSGELCERLRGSRPLPRAEFLHDLSAVLSSALPAGETTAHVRAKIAGLAATGLLLLAAAAAITFL